MFRPSCITTSFDRKRVSFSGGMPLGSGPRPAGGTELTGGRPALRRRLGCRPDDRRTRCRRCCCCSILIGFLGFFSVSGSLRRRVRELQQRQWPARAVRWFGSTVRGSPAAPAAAAVGIARRGRSRHRQRIGLAGQEGIVAGAACSRRSDRIRTAVRRSIAPLSSACRRRCGPGRWSAYPSRSSSRCRGATAEPECRACRGRPAGCRDCSAPPGRRSCCRGRPRRGPPHRSGRASRGSARRVRRTVLPAPPVTAPVA